MATCRIQLSLRVSALEEDVPGLVEKISITGDTVKKIADRSLPTKRRIVWSKSSALPEDAPLDDHVQAIVDLAGRVTADLFCMRGDLLRLDLFLGLSLDDYQGGASMSEKSSRIIADLGLPLELDIYGA